MFFHSFHAWFSFVLHLDGATPLGLISVENICIPHKIFKNGVQKALFCLDVVGPHF